MANFTYILADNATGEAAIIDPSWEIEKVVDTLKRNRWRVKYIVNTHTHFDHVLGNDQMAALTGAKIVQHKDSTLGKDVSVADGDTISIGGLMVRIIHTPGHSPESMCLLLDGHFLVTGDTLFVGNCGRTDLEGSDPRQLYHSLFQRIAILDDKLVIYPGHDYGPTPTSTIGNEKKTNFVLQPRSEKEFLDFMGAGD